jgi:hypothetical protein
VSYALFLAAVHQAEGPRGEGEGSGQCEMGMETDLLRRGLRGENLNRPRHFYIGRFSVGGLSFVPSLLWWW